MGARTHRSRVQTSRGTTVERNMGPKCTGTQRPMVQEWVQGSLHKSYGAPIQEYGNAGIQLQLSTHIQCVVF